VHDSQRSDEAQLVRRKITVATTVAAIAVATSIAVATTDATTAYMLASG
jgi:hypothetical protein